MKLFIVALVATAFGQELQNHCGDSLTPKWTEETMAGWYCRCAAKSSNYEFDGECKLNTDRQSCYTASVQGQSDVCTWRDDLIPFGPLPQDTPKENPTDGPFFESDGTLIDCDGKVFTADSCAYRNKRNCEDYLGDGICDFGQRFTKEGVRTGPNLACPKFNLDKGDCECNDTMTCDGYCLDDFACEKADYGFTTCANWYQDGVCDYGQRTSDFGVSINFDCHITHVEALKDVLNYNHDMMERSGCQPWSWDKRYTTEEYLENFVAECPSAAPTQNPTGQPTKAPTQTDAPTEMPTLDLAGYCNEYCINSYQDAGNWDACCSVNYSGIENACVDFEDKFFGGGLVCQEPEPTNNPTSAPVEEDSPEPDLDCSTAKAKGECETARGPVRTCSFDKSRPKGQRCFPTPDDGCQIRFTKGKKIGQFDKKTCADTDGCGFVTVMSGPKVIAASGPKIGQEIATANLAESYCYKTNHVCNKYTKKTQCTIKAPSEGNMCQFDTKGQIGFKCIARESFECTGFKKKKECDAWGQFGCSFIKKKSDKPASMKAFKCIDTTDPTYTEWLAAKKEGSGKKKGRL